MKITSREEAHRALKDLVTYRDVIELAMEHAATAVNLNNKRELEREKKALEDALKEWIQEDGEELVDNEIGATTNLRVNLDKPTYDLVTFAETAEAAADLLALARSGMLRVDHEMLTRHPGAAWIDRVKRSKEPAKVRSVALYIERGQ